MHDQHARECDVQENGPDFRYYDGRTAQPYTVKVEAQGEHHLRITSPSGAIMAIWSLESLVLPDFMKPPYALTHTPGTERLTVVNQAAHGQLAPYLNGIRRSAFRASIRRWGRVSAVAWLLGLMAWWAFPYLVDAVVARVPIETEHRLGNDVREQLGTLLAKKRDGKAKWCEQQEGVSAIASLVERLSVAEPSSYTFSVKVVDSQIMNAFAAPGGSMLVTSALLEMVETPEELAGIIAHEMGHVKEQHGLRNMAGSYGVQLASTILFGHDGGFMGGAARSLALRMTTSSWSRDYERAADAYAFALLEKSGISTSGLLTFFERLEEEAGHNQGVFAYLGMLSSHPETVERINTFRMLVEEQAAAAGGAAVAESALSWEAWEAVRNICE